MSECKYCKVRHPDFFCPVEEKLKKQGLNLLNKIKECMVQDNNNGGRCILDIDKKDMEEIMYLATGQYHNSKCCFIVLKSDGTIFCNKPVSCVCTSECNHIWYCPEHIGNHKHTRWLTY